MRGDVFVLGCLVAALGCTGTIDEPEPLTPIIPLPPRMECEGPPLGAPIQLSRLTRVQYNLAVQDLLGVDLAPAEAFSADESVANFEVARSISALQVEGHLGAATELAEAADLGVVLPCDTFDATCADLFVERFGRRAFRRPLQVAETEDLRAIVDLGAEPEGLEDAMAFERGVRLAIETMIASPQFLYHSTLVPSDLSPSVGDSVRLDPYAFASRLAFFLWNSTPDDTLLDAAPDLGDDALLEAQLSRMMDDARFERTVLDFARQWLHLDAVSNLLKDEIAFADFDADLARELRASVERQVLEEYRRPDATLSDLLTGETLYASPWMAAVYGLETTSGEGLQATRAPTGERAGLMTHPALMALLAKPDQGDPIHRGLFILEQLFCRELPEPNMDDVSVPPFVPGQSTRDRFAAHTANNACRACHSLIDPLGFGFEQFDGMGRFRATEEGSPVDASGEFPDAIGLSGSYTNATEMMEAISTSDRVQTCFATQWWRYAHRRIETLDDQCAIEQVADSFAESGTNLRALVRSVVQDESFQNARFGQEGAR